MLLKSLYQGFPTVPWYGFYLFLPLGSGIWAFLAALWTARAPWPSLGFFLLAFLGIYTFFFYQLSFTITPNLEVQGGLFLLASLWECPERKKALFFLLSSLLFLSASIIRLDGFLLALFTALPFILYLLIRRRPGVSLKPWAQFLAHLTLGVVALALFSHQYGQGNPEWKTFLDFDHHIEQLLNYRDTFYDEKTKPYFDEVRWSQNDLNLFHEMCYIDHDKFNCENFEKLIPHFPRGTNGGKPGTINSIRDLLTDWRALVLIILSFVFFLFNKSSERLLYLINALWVIGLLFLLIYFYRAPERVYLPMLCFLMNLALFHAQPSDTQVRPAQILGCLTRTNLLLVMSAILILAGPFRQYHSYDQLLQAKEQFLNKCLETLQPKKDELYVIWDSSFPYESTNAFDSFEKFRNFNIFPLAVFQNSPQCQTTLARFQVHEVFKDLVDNPKIFLVCHNPETLYYGQYMLEKYRIPTYPEKTFSNGLFPLFNIYRVHSKPDWHS
jgi:hypothetical protein